MKNRKIASLAQVGLAIILFFSLTRGLCYASGIAIGNESATLSFYGDDAGVYYLITDPQGRRTGYDPILKQEVEEFPASFDFSFEGRDEISGKYHGSADFNLIPGTYTVEVFGVTLTAYDLDIRIRRIPSERPTKIDIKNATPEQIAAINAMSTDFSFGGVIDKGRTYKYQFTYTSDPTKPAGIATKIIASSSLKQDITLSRKIGLIDNDGIMKSLLGKVGAIEASIAKGNKTAAKNQLNAFINEINAQGCNEDERKCRGKYVYTSDFEYDEKTDTDIEVKKQVCMPECPQNKHIMPEAVKILLEGAQYLMESLSK